MILSCCRSYLNGTLEQIQGGLLIVAGGLGLIGLILVIFEVVFRCCLKPTPMVPKLVALFAFLQFLALAGMVITLLGANAWKTPAGTHIGPTLWANIIGIGAAFLAFVLMWLAAIAEKNHYKGRFKVCRSALFSGFCFTSARMSTAPAPCNLGRETVVNPFSVCAEARFMLKSIFHTLGVRARKRGYCPGRCHQAIQETGTD
jgi:hypothetical protein